MERIFNFFLSLVLAASCAAFGSPANSGGAPLPENGAGSSAAEYGGGKHRRQNGRLDSGRLFLRHRNNDGSCGNYCPVP